MSILHFARVRVTTLTVALGLLAGATVAVIQAPAAMAAACNFAQPSPLPSADGRIETASDLQWLYDTSAAWSGTWEQTQDIDMGGCEFDEGIGGASPYSTGSYDGGGYLIEGLDIAGSTLSAGLFADVNGGTLTGIRFSGSVTSSNGAVGGLTGQIYGGGQISDSSTSGTVNSGGNQVGGLVGRATGAPRTPPGFELIGWTDANTPAGSGQAQEGAATYEPGATLPEVWNLEIPNPINAVRLYALWGRTGTSPIS